ncbi:MAG: PEP-CTERM sorting domain-containing protein [Planctomycetota bacterium]
MPPRASKPLSMFSLLACDRRRHLLFVLKVCLLLAVLVLAGGKATSAHVATSLWRYTCLSDGEEIVPVAPAYQTTVYVPVGGTNIPIYLRSGHGSCSGEDYFYMGFEPGGGGPDDLLSYESVRAYTYGAYGWADLAAFPDEESWRTDIYIPPVENLVAWAKLVPASGTWACGSYSSYAYSAGGSGGGGIGTALKVNVPGTFVVTPEPSPVPEPPTIFLAALSLIAIVVASWRRRQLSLAAAWNR